MLSHVHRACSHVSMPLKTDNHACQNNWYEINVLQMNMETCKIMESAAENAGETE